MSQWQIIIIESEIPSLLIDLQILSVFPFHLFRKDEFNRVEKLPVKPPGWSIGCWNAHLAEFQNLLSSSQIEDEVKLIAQNKDQKSVAFASEVNIIPDVPEQQKSKNKKDCPICLEEKSTKKMTFLSCAHALCNRCLRKLRKRNNRGDYIVLQQCPVCRHSF